MKYIIMCGGEYAMWDKPKHLIEVNGEPIVARTIRLLKEQGITDIAISSNNPLFEQFGVPVLKHDNDYYSRGYNDNDGSWCSAFYPTDRPTCYIFGDVIFSPNAIKTIVETETDDIMLFGSKAPFAPEYPKSYREPFAFKVANTRHLKQTIVRVKQLDALHKFKRRPIAWELWTVIKGTNIRKIDMSYAAINDYTCDIDSPDEIEKVLPYIDK